MPHRPSGNRVHSPNAYRAAQPMRPVGPVRAAQPADPYRTRRAERERRRREAHRRRRRRRLVAVLLVFSALLIGADLIRRGIGIGAVASGAARPSSPASASPSATAEESAAPSPSAPASPEPVLALAGDYPRSGPGTWVYDQTQGAVLGRAGTVRRFRVAVETGVPEDVAAFAATVDRVLGDPRGWTAGGTFRLQRVPQNASAEFTIYLATPQTAYEMCRSAGLDIRSGGVPYTSCRTFGRVIINLSRWRESVPDYVNNGIPLDVYRQYVINHETGHQLGFGHELCPGAGKPAPVMQTQTLGLTGCTANPWPYLNGSRYHGPRA